MRIAVYPTSANPPTYGHADILVRTSKLFDHVYWSAAMNSEKEYIFTEEGRVKMMNEYVKHYDLKIVTVEAFRGSTIRYVQRRKAQIIVKSRQEPNTKLLLVSLISYIKHIVFFSIHADPDPQRIRGSVSICYEFLIEICY